MSLRAWKMLGYDSFNSLLDIRLNEWRLRDSNYGAARTSQADYVWIIRKEYAEFFEHDLSFETQSVAFSEGRFWSSALHFGTVEKHETDRDAVVRIALTEEEVKDPENWEIKPVGYKAYTVKQRSPAMIAEFEQELFIKEISEAKKSTEKHTKTRI
jgi:hypothetical protein